MKSLVKVVAVLLGAWMLCAPVLAATPCTRTSGRAEHCKRCCPMMNEMSMGAHEDSAQAADRAMPSPDACCAVSPAGSSAPAIVPGSHDPVEFASPSQDALALTVPPLRAMVAEPVFRRTAETCAQSRLCTFLI